MNKKQMDELKKRLHEISYLYSILATIHWDQEVNMPPKGADARATSISYLSGIAHTKFVSIDKDKLLTSLKKKLDTKKLRGSDAVIVEEIWKDYEKARKLPEAFVKELSAVTSKAQGVWAEARKKNDFSLFLPWLSKIVTLKRKQATLLGYKKSPYDALLDAHESGMTTEEASQILNDLKAFLIPFLQKIKQAQKKSSLKKITGHFSIEKQIIINRSIAEKLGFDLEAGRIDVAVHPFNIGLHPTDVRLTTRYRESDLFHSIGSTIHETGHALYEQGLLAEHFGTPLGDAISLGIHESQSRMWENMIGKSKSFVHHLLPFLRGHFPKPFSTVSEAELYAAINNVNPSLIRTEADEVTYNLHIIIRFEIEKEIIEGSIDLKDLPTVWKQKVKEYLGIDVPSDTLGVLQDVHWSHGSFGYFPTYTFGNLYAAQFYHAMSKDMPDISKNISKGNFKPIREWLRKHIHRHGKNYTTEKLVKKLTGESLNSRYFTEYLEKKYGDIYFK